MSYLPLLWLWRLWSLGVVIIALGIGLLPFVAGAVYLRDRFSCQAPVSETPPPAAPTRT